MKKRFILFVLLFVYAATMPLHAADDQNPQRSRFSNSLRSLQSKATQTFKSARSTLTQKATCLINYDSCTSRDKLAISSAFGFMMGYGFNYKTITEQLLEKVITPSESDKITSSKMLYHAFIYTIAFAMANAIGLTGPLFMHHTAGIPGMFTTGFFSAKDKRAWLATTGREYARAGNFEKFIFIFVIAIEAYDVLQEALYAVQYEKKSPLISIARYLKMNAKCIWDQKYCMPQENAEQRRLGLYFWLGYIQGHVVRTVQAPFFNYWSRHKPSTFGGGTTGRRLGRA